MKHIDLAALDRKLIWHPFTQEKIAALPLVIEKAEKSYLYDEEGKAYVDLISSWWVNLHGHAHPHIAQAIYNQAQKLEHVIFAGFTHSPAINLCEKLQTLLPESLSKFFFSDNGSTAVEVALKMAYQYWWNQAEVQRTLFLSFSGAYHGDTFGAMSVGVQSGYHHLFTPLLFKVFSLPFPSTWMEDAKIELKEQRAFETLEHYLYDHHQQIAALILEPLVQGASGMRMWRPRFIKKVVDLVRSYKILIIFDEVMTGFGRTGTYFALQQTEVDPDFLCLAKGLTGGFLPLALTVTTEEVYKVFLSNHFEKAFAHGHSYTANPLACAAAIASLELLVKSSTLASVRAIHKAHEQGIIYLKEACDHYLYNFRIIGTIAAFEVRSPQACSNLNQMLKNKFLEQGLLLRPLGKTICLLPPYSIEPKELQLAYEKIVYVVKKLMENIYLT